MLWKAVLQWGTDVLSILAVQKGDIWKKFLAVLTVFGKVESKTPVQKGTPEVVRRAFWTTFWDERKIGLF